MRYPPIPQPPRWKHRRRRRRWRFFRRFLCRSTRYPPASGTPPSPRKRQRRCRLWFLKTVSCPMKCLPWTPRVRRQAISGLDVTAQADYNQPVRLYALTQANTWQPLESWEEKGVVTAIVNLEGLASDGKLTVLVQARGAEYQPVTTRPATADTVANDYVWVAPEFRSSMTLPLPGLRTLSIIPNSLWRTLMRSPIGL